MINVKKDHAQNTFDWPSLWPVDGQWMSRTRVAWELLDLICVWVWHVIETHLPTYCLWHLEPYRIHQDDLKLLRMFWHFVCGTSPMSLTGAWSFGILNSTNTILWTCVIYSHVFGFNPLIHNRLCRSLFGKHKSFYESQTNHLAS